MFGLSVATEIFQGSTARTWNCVSHFVRLLWTKLSHIKQPIMPKSRKRHHSRSRSRSRSHSRDRSHEREDKHKKNSSHEKDRDGKRRKIESYDSPAQKRSVSSEPECCDLEKNSSTEEHLDASEEIKHESTKNRGAAEIKEATETDDDVLILETVEDKKELSSDKCYSQAIDDTNRGAVSSENLGSKAESYEEVVVVECQQENSSFEKQSRKGLDSDSESTKTDASTKQTEDKENVNNRVETLNFEKPMQVFDSTNETEDSRKIMKDCIVLLNDLNDASESKKSSSSTPKKTPKQVQKKLESENKRKQRQLEKEEKERKKVEERERIKQEKLKKQKEKEQKKKERQEQEEQRKKEREEKEEQKRKEREEKEQKKKEKEEREEQKRKEREQEKLKKQLEIEEKNKEKQKEEEKKQKAAAAFVNFFFAKKSDNNQEDKKTEITQPYAFMAFQVKSDMKLPPLRRKILSEKERENLERYLEHQDDTISYVKELKSGKPVGKSFKTWPFEEATDDDVTIVDEANLGETICEDKSKVQKFHAKFLKFHENRRPAYFGSWRKKSKFITPRKPFAEDNEVFNYEEDSDDDWEEEEQGESLNGSDDEADKENEDEKDDYEVDNEFFVPHGHLSEDEIDDEEKARLSPESLKQKLKLLKDEFDQDMQSKTHKLKPRSIGCIWYDKNGSNVEDAILRYLQPLAMISQGQVQIKERSEIFTSNAVCRKNRAIKELTAEQIPLFLKVIHRNSNRKGVLVEQFLTYMANNDFTVDIKKATLVRHLKKLATWKKCLDNGPMKNKFCWLVNDGVEKQYSVDLSLPNILESDIKK